jgi:beta-galactosidase GanA
LVVEYFPWAITSRPGRYDWTHADLVVNHARAQGLEVIARIDFVPEWARPKETTYRYLDRDHYVNYAAFAAAFLSIFVGSALPRHLERAEPEL